MQSVNNVLFLVIVNNRYDQNLLRRISKDVEIILINRPEGNRWNLLFILQLWKTLLRIKPDIIHAHTHNLIKILAPFKKRCVYTVHQLGISLHHLSKYRKIFAVSNAVKADLYQRGDLNSILIYNGINFSDFLKKGCYELRDEVFRIVQISRLHKDKGADVLIHAMHKIINDFKISNIIVDIIGEGKTRSDLQLLIEKYDLADHVKLPGPKDRTWINKNLCDYHLLVQPSRSEGFGLTLIEAIASGLPVITSEIDGPAEVVKDVSSAYLFETENADELAGKIMEVLYDYQNDLIHAKCIQGLEMVKHKFSLANTASSYLKHYVD